MNIDSSINKLLFSHDCVIVPGLGGFVASVRPAAHNKVQHTFIPPARVIAFNVFLKQNDGLLANHISAAENISFGEAMLLIERYVERCFTDMAAGRRFRIEEVGVLYYDAEKNIQFEPDDSALHALDSFGLTTIRAIPINAKASSENALFSPLRQSVSPEEKRKTQKIFSNRKLMNALLIAGITLWASFNLYIIAPRHFNLGNLNPFSKTEVAKPETKTTSAPVPSAKPIPPVVNSIPLPAENKIEENKSVASENLQPEKIEAKKPDAVKAETPSGENRREIKGNYFVVAGVFRILSNAENFLVKLREDGYESSGAIERENKPTIVFVSQHQLKEEAMRSVQSLKEKGIDAWVYAGKN